MDDVSTPEYAIFQDAERTFAAHGFDDVHFYAEARATTEETYDPDVREPPEMYLFHGLSDGKVRPRVRGKAQGQAMPLKVVGRDRDGDESDATAGSIPWAASNLTAWIFVNVQPHYFKFPPFPEERGYANEVQRARIAAKSQWPKIMFATTEENSVDMDDAAVERGLLAAGAALKRNGAGALFHLNVPEQELVAMLHMLGVGDDDGRAHAKKKLETKNQVYFAYFDPVSLLFGTAFHDLSEDVAAANATGLAESVGKRVLSFTTKMERDGKVETMDASWAAGARPPLRGADDLKNDEAFKHNRESVKTASFVGMMAPFKDQVPYPGAIGSPEFLKVYEPKENGLWVKRKEGVKKGKKAKRAKKAAAGADEL